MMEQRISAITLSVADLSRSREFYETGLGWRPAFANEEVAFYQMNGVILSLFDLGGFETEVHAVGDTSQAARFALAYNVRSRAEVDDVMAAAKAAGGSILKPARDMSWGGYCGHFADLDGHPWEVAWNPDWSLDDQGNIVIGAS